MKYLIDSTTLTGIADSIRAKTGETGTIKVSELYSKVDSIPTGETINNQDKTITQNGTYNADEGYTGLGTVVVDVPSSEPTLQDKAIEITENGATEVTADEGYDGINSVEITTNVSGGESNPYQGTFDVEGLKYLGYDDDTIEWYNAHFPWGKTGEDLFKLTDEDKAVKDEMPDNITSKDDISSYADTLEYMPMKSIDGVTDMSYWFQNFTLLKTVPKFDTSNVTNLSYLFSGCSELITVPKLDTSKSKTFAYMFYSCSSLLEVPLIDITSSSTISGIFRGCSTLKTIPKLDTKSVSSFSYAFYGCTELKKIPLLDFSRATSVITIFTSCSNLEEVGGFLDFGKNFLTTRPEGYSNYNLSVSNCSKLTHESLMNIINNLYDIATKGCNTQKVTLGSTNLAKLTAEEIEIATNKGWTLA